MILSDFEKEILHFINKDDVNDLGWFFVNLLKPKGVINEDQNFRFLEFTIEHGSSVYTIEDENEILIKSAVFLTLMEKLTKENLVLIVNLPTKKVIPIFKNIRDIVLEPNDILMKLYYEYSDKFYVTTKALHKFIENNYMTEQEIKDENDKKDREEEKRLRLKMYEDEKIDRKDAQNTTRLIGYASIIASVLMTLITVLVNIYTFTNERKVQIVNTEPSKVEIVNPEIQRAIKSLPENKQQKSDTLIQITKK